MEKIAKSKSDWVACEKSLAYGYGTRKTYRQGLCSKIRTMICINDRVNIIIDDGVV